MSPGRAMDNTPRPPSDTPAGRLAAARRRLETSRGRLIRTLYPDPGPDHAGRDAAPSDTGAHDWAQALGSATPWAALRRLALRWWQRQPWHQPVELVARTAARQVRPLVHRHPWAALAAGALAGAALAAAGPWLLRGSRRHTAPLRQHLAGSLWSTLGSTSVQVALASALVAWMERQSHPDTATTAPPTDTTGAEGPP